MTGRSSWRVALTLTTGLMMMAAAPLSPRDHLDRARVCQAALDFDCAHQELVSVRADLERLTADEVVEALRRSVEVALTRGEGDAARGLLQVLLEREPEFEAPAWPGDWQRALDEARRLAPDRVAPTLVVEAPTESTEEVPIELVARVDDRSGVGRVILYVRRADEAPLTFAMATTDGDTWRAQIPAELVVPPALAVWVEAFDRLGNGPRRWHDATNPGLLPVGREIAPPDEPVYTQWWFWTAIGVGVVGGAVALAVALDGGDETSGATGSYGDLQPRFDYP